MEAFKRLNLENIDTPTVFKFKFTRGEKSFFIEYTDEDNIGYEDFFNMYSDFFSCLHHHYEGRIEKSESIEEKANILDEYKLNITKYQIELSNFYPLLSSKIEKDIRKYKNYIEAINECSSSMDIIRPKIHLYSAKQKILILEYTGMLKALGKLDLTEKQKAEIVAVITGFSSINITKYLRNMVRIGKGKEYTKTENTLKEVHNFFINNNMPSLANKIQEELKR